MKVILKLFYKYIAILIFFLVWEVLPRAEWVNPLFIPPFSKVMVTTWELLLTEKLAMHTMTSLGRALAGFLVAAAIALPLGLLLGGWFRNLQLALEPLMEVFSQANPFILFHIILLFFGIGEVTKVTIIAWMCIWPILFNTVAGIRNIESDLLKTAGSFGLSRGTLFYKVVLPAAAPAIFTGLRLSSGYAFFMLIAAEMMGASSGLGWYILNSQENYHITRIFAAAAVIALLGLLIDTLIQAIEKKVITWEDTESWIVTGSDGFKTKGE